MQHRTFNIMAVDDDAMNLEILTKNLEDAGFVAQGYVNSQEAWQQLQEHPEDTDILLLDKMMPNLDGMKILENIKKHETLQHIPVIIQTGDIGPEQTREGLAAGAYYYLEKPFEPSVMVALVNAAARDCVLRNEMQQHLQTERSITMMVYEGKFRLRTLEEAKKIAAALAYHGERPEEISMALSEIIVNAVEHGNLNISYDQKAAMLSDGTYDKEIERRLDSFENRNKYVDVQFYSRGDENRVIVTDEGDCFDWEKYLEFEPLRLTDPNGRGIAAARLMRLNLQYQGKGNQVVCTFAAKNAEHNSAEHANEQEGLNQSAVIPASPNVFPINKNRIDEF